jgi:hypothetical protein
MAHLESLNLRVLKVESVYLLSLSRVLVVFLRVRVRLYLLKTLDQTQFLAVGLVLILATVACLFMVVMVVMVGLAQQTELRQQAVAEQVLVLT